MRDPTEVTQFRLPLLFKQEGNAGLDLLLIRGVDYNVDNITFSIQNQTYLGADRTGIALDFYPQL